jgi:hypothetical protein
MARTHHTHRPGEGSDRSAKLAEPSMTEAEVDRGEISYLARIGLSESVPSWHNNGLSGDAVIAEAIDALAREVVRLRADLDALTAP